MGKAGSKIGSDERMDGDGSDEVDPSADKLQLELAKFAGTPVGFLSKDQYRPSYRLYGSSGGGGGGPLRGAPDGKERGGRPAAAPRRQQLPFKLINPSQLAAAHVR